MKLLFVTDNGFCNKADSFYYSAPNVAHIQNLNSFFDDFIVVAREDKYYPGYKIVPQNIEVHLVNKYNVLKLKSIIKKLIKDCDAVICYGTNGYFASKIGRKMEKIVISYNGGDPYDFCISRGNLKGKILAPISRYMCRKSFENSDFGHYCDDFLFNRYPASGKMLACSGVDIECFPSILEKRIRRIQNKKDSSFKIGITGHLHNSLKGIDIAIKAISKLDNNFILEIAGRGDPNKYYELAESLGCKKQVRFLGVLKPGDELMSWLDSLDLYIQPSRIEGLPRATIEAMSRGCPIVSSRAGALLKLIDKEYTFDVKENEDGEALSHLIKNINNVKSLMEQAKTNFEKSKKYERKERDKKYNEFYSQIVDKINERK